MTLLLVMVGAAAGAAARWSLDRWIARRRPSAFPLGTFTINVIGTFVLAVVLGASPGAAWVALLGTGLCGGFTTFSAFSFETVRLLEEGRGRPAGMYVAASLAAGLLVAVPGYLLGGLAG